MRTQEQFHAPKHDATCGFRETPTSERSPEHHAWPTTRWRHPQFEEYTGYVSGTTATNEADTAWTIERPSPAAGVW